MQELEQAPLHPDLHDAGVYAILARQVSPQAVLHVWLHPEQPDDDPPPPSGSSSGPQAVSSVGIVIAAIAGIIAEALFLKNDLRFIKSKLSMAYFPEL